MPIWNPAAVPPAADVGEGHITILPWNYDSIEQGTWVLLLDTAHIFNGRFYNSTNADGDSILYKVYLQAGTYTLRVMYFKVVNGAIIDIDIDATEVTSWDAYALTGVKNSIHSQTGINIATSGLYTLRLRTDGKHASSTGYIASIQAITLWRTA